MSRMRTAVLLGLILLAGIIVGSLAYDGGYYLGSH